jgi:1,4-alpha-glucan branching enzyme
MKNLKTTGKGRYPRKRIKFELQADPDSKIYIAGSFNNWNPKERKLKDKQNNGNYSLFVLVPKGKQEYKFIINDDWCLDPNCIDKKKNKLGTYNNFINVD